MRFQPLTPALMDDLGTVLKGSWGASCWCMFPRLTDKQLKALPGDGPLKDRRRASMQAIASRAIAPGLIAYIDGRPAGWIAIAPRAQFGRVAASKATPPVDSEDVWVIPCLTVRKDARGTGIGVAMISAAVKFASNHGAMIVEGYPRAGNTRTGADNIYFGTETLLAKAGFTVVRGPLENRPKNWLPRLAMRFRCGNC